MKERGKGIVRGENGMVGRERDKQRRKGREGEKKNGG